MSGAASPKKKGGAIVPPTQAVDLEKLPIEDFLRRILIAGHDADNMGRWDGTFDAADNWQVDRAMVVFWAVCETVRSGCTEEDMLGILLSRDLAISGHIHDQKGAEGYARRQVREAQESVEDSFVTDKDGRTATAWRWTTPPLSASTLKSTSGLASGPPRISSMTFWATMPAATPVTRSLNTSRPCAGTAWHGLTAGSPPTVGRLTPHSLAPSRGWSLSPPSAGSEGPA